MRHLLCKRANPEPRALLSSEFFRYLMVSAVALAVDWGLLIFFTEVVGVHYLLSAAIGFCAGLACAYIQSIAFVFRTRSLSNPRWEFALFCAIGVLGLGLTQFMLYFIVASTGVSYALAKGPVAGVTFVVNFGLRRVFLFSNAAATSETVVPAN